MALWLLIKCLLPFQTVWARNQKQAGACDRSCVTNSGNKQAHGMPFFSKLWRLPLNSVQ